MAKFFSQHVICLFAVACLIVYGMVYLGGAFPEPIRADGVGYYAYLPAFFIHGDPSFETLARLRFDGEMPRWAGFVKNPDTARYANKYGVGVAMMLAPFFVGAHLLTYFFRSPPAPWHHFNYAADGFSFFYQHAAGLGAMFYGLCGLFFLKRALERRFSRGVALAAICALFFGTNLFNYLSGETVLSHPFSFFLFACLLDRLPNLYDERRVSWRDYAIAGVCMGLIAAVRIPNVTFGIVAALYGVTNWADFRNRCSWGCQHWRAFSLTIILAGLFFLPQLLCWKYATGRWWANVYAQMDANLFNWLNPQFGLILFSLRRGIFFWSPILIFSIAGFFALKRSARELFWGGLLYVIWSMYLSACWFVPDFGGGFGHRGFVESYVVLAFPLAAFYQQVSESPRRWLRWSVGALSLAMVGWSLFFQMLYYTREISLYGLDRQALFDIFWWRKQLLEAWWQTLLP